MSSHGRFVWNELATTDPKRAMDFYTRTLGWSFSAFELPGGAYWVARLRGDFVAGIGEMKTGPDRNALRPYWHSCIEVDDVDARLDIALENGAILLEPPHDVPNIGRVAYLLDPTGAHLCLMTGLAQDAPSKVSRVIPALRVTDYERSIAFYVDRLSFEVTSEHRFTPNAPAFLTVERDGLVFFLTEHEEDCQPGGLIHLFVEDVDSWHEELVERGVPIAQPPGNTLPGVRDMVVVDPDGNRICILTRTDVSGLHR